MVAPSHTTDPVKEHFMKKTQVMRSIRDTRNTMQPGSTRQRDSLVITQHKQWDPTSGSLQLAHHSTGTMSMKDKRSPMRISRNTPPEPEEIKGAQGRRLDQVLHVQGKTTTGDDADTSLQRQIAPVDNAQRYVPMNGPKAKKDTTDRIPFKRKR